MSFQGAFVLLKNRNKIEQELGCLIILIECAACIHFDVRFTTIIDEM